MVGPSGAFCCRSRRLARTTGMAWEVNEKVAKRKGSGKANQGFNLQSTPSVGKGPRGKAISGTRNAGSKVGNIAAHKGFNIQSAK